MAVGCTIIIGFASVFQDEDWNRLRALISTIVYPIAVENTFVFRGIYGFDQSSFDRLYQVNGKQWYDKVSLLMITAIKRETAIRIAWAPQRSRSLRLRGG